MRASRKRFPALRIRRATGLKSTVPCGARRARIHDFLTNAAGVAERWEARWSTTGNRLFQGRIRRVSGRIVEDAKIKTRKAFGIKDAVNLDDLAARNR
jgi:hypothetical protein